MGILKEQKDKVKQLTGYNYSKQFKNFLDEKGIENKNGNFYSVGHIRWYFCIDTSGSNPLDEYFLEFWEIISKQNQSHTNRIEKLAKKTRNILKQ